nr:LPD11 domain-containing protein [uncultured Oscillibacter sp.]
MSDQNSSFPFESIGQEEGLEIAAIFGGGTPENNTNPFEAMMAQQAEPIAPPTQPQTVESAPSQEAPAPQTAPAQTAAAVTTLVPETTKALQPSSTLPANTEDNPISAAFAKQEEAAAQTAAKSLFEKVPVFSYGSAKEDITDPAQTFEELRIAKSDDFPELSEGKRVSWSVEYGKVTKAITDPKGTTIRSVKEEIEQSKVFLDGLKKAKDKNPDCLVKPRVTAQSKGIASYKGVFPTLEEAQASEKPICLIPSDDGRVYELRKTELGEFLAPKEKVIDFQQIRAGFTPALPLIPLELLQQIISFFRCYMGGTQEFEALAHILWDKEEKEFTVHVPRQSVSKARIDADLSQDMPSEERYLHYADIHSHNSMEAKFSSVDDQDERATRLYIVLGRLDRFFPDISVRMSCGGTYQELDPGAVIEGLGTVFPREWRAQVTTCSPEFEPEPGIARVFPVRSRKAAPTEEFETKLPGMSEGHRYRLLSRFQMDCEYYLGAGNRCAKFLWAGTEQAHISAMLALWDSFPEKRRPEWISREDILRYKARMLGELAA